MVSNARLKVREAELADRYAQGVSHLNQERWQDAVAVFTAIEQEQPGYRDAAALRKEAEQNLSPGTKGDVEQGMAPPVDFQPNNAPTSESPITTEDRPTAGLHTTETTPILPRSATFSG